MQSDDLATILFESRLGIQRAPAPSGGLQKKACYDGAMMNSRTVVESLSPFDLRSATQQLVLRSHGVEAALLVHLGQIEERKLYLDWSFSSMFGYCVGELGFSEDVACNRISLARAARRMPIILDVEGTGRGRGQVEAPDRGAGRASCAAANGPIDRAQTSSPAQFHAGVSHPIAPHRRSGSAARVAACIGVRAANRACAAGHDCTALRGHLQVPVHHDARVS